MITLFLVSLAIFAVLYLAIYIKQTGLTVRVVDLVIWAFLTESVYNVKVCFTLFTTSWPKFGRVTSGAIINQTISTDAIVLPDIEPEI